MSAEAAIDILIVWRCRLVDEGGKPDGAWLAVGGTTMLDDLYDLMGDDGKCSIHVERAAMTPAEFEALPEWDGP